MKRKIDWGYGLGIIALIIVLAVCVVGLLTSERPCKSLCECGIVSEMEVLAIWSENRTVYGEVRNVSCEEWLNMEVGE